MEAYTFPPLNTRTFKWDSPVIQQPNIVFFLYLIIHNGKSKWFVVSILNVLYFLAFPFGMN